MKPALFVQDIQNVWLYEPDSNQDLRRSVERRLDAINEAIAWFRSKGLPVIVGYTENEEEGVTRGTESFEVPDTIGVEDADFKVTKRHANAFANPELGAKLRSEGCDSVVIVGLSASGCVLATYFSAYDFEVRPYLLKGCVASANEEHVRFAEEICDTVSLQELADAIR
jgi:nicotinamidase-related amidase